MSEWYFVYCDGEYVDYYMSERAAAFHVRQYCDAGKFAWWSTVPETEETLDAIIDAIRGL